MPEAAFKVLVTGSSGLIGGVVIRTLGDKYTFSGLDRAQTVDAPDIPTTVADVGNFEAIRYIKTSPLAFYAFYSTRR